MNPNDIRDADRNIVEYLHPYARHFATVFSTEINNLGRNIEPKRQLASDGQFEENSKIFFVNYGELRPCLARSFHHLSQFITKYPESSKMATLLRDYETITRQAREFEHEMSLLFQVEVAQRTLEESILSKRVGWLAFFFLPLKFNGIDFWNECDDSSEHPA